MRAVYLEGYESLDQVTIGEKPMPEPGPGEVRVRMAVGGYNHVDLYMLSGGAGISHQLPLTLGVDGAGVVDALGPGTTMLAEGDRVALYPIEYCGKCEFCLRGDQSLCIKCKIHGEQIDGCFSEYMVVPEYVPHRISADTSFADAAMLSCAYLVAWRMINTQARLRPTQSILIQGIGGGVAVAGLQFAKICGARIIVTSSSDEKLEKAREIGADAGINYKSEKIARRVMELTDGRGVDVVLDNVGQATWSESLKSLVRGGKLVICGATTGPAPPADLQRIFIRQLEIHGAMLGTQEEYRAMLQALEEKRFAPVIDRIFELEAVRDGLARMKNAEQFGKMGVRIAEI
jgi:NADPH:quinone reductase-like Zn-dependent oxidoreductase